MTLFFVIGDISNYGGTERVTTEISAALAEAKHEVSILSLSGPAEPRLETPNSRRLSASELHEHYRTNGETPDKEPFLNSELSQ